MKKEKGITLASLIIVMLVMLILASVTISIVISDNSLERASNAASNHQLDAFEEELKIYQSKQQMKSKNSYYNPKCLYADYDRIVYVYGENNVEVDGEKSIYDILKNLENSNLDGEIWIKAGEIVFEPIEEELNSIFGG